MPARRQHRRGDGLTRKEREAVRRAEMKAAIAARTDVYAVDPAEVDRTWSEHQEWERHRRYAPSYEMDPRVALDRKVKQRAEMRKAFAAVMADFSRWDGERAAREDLDLMN